MSIVTRLLSRLRVSRLEQDLHDEVDFHIEMRAGQHVKAGMSQEDAMKRARETFGDIGAVIGGMRRARLSYVTTLVTIASLIGVLAVVWVLQVTRSATIPQAPPAPAFLQLHSLDAPGKTPPPPPPPPPSREECLEQAKRIPRICQ
jgi:hypothetical protein